MKSRKLIAKSNLKKSIYLGGGMAAFTAAVGLAVSIPVYNKIQEELAKTTSKLKDLSSMMSQLTDKLGIPEGASFQKELAGGYEVVYENGETKIYKNNGEGKSLIINMNGDGTVGSAAQMQGPAAQTMLGVIQNAKASMEDDQDAMSDIIGPFADDAEVESLKTESAVTGESVAALAQRNALAAAADAEAQKAAQARLKEIQAKLQITQDQMKAAADRAAQLKATALKEKEDADKLAEAKRAGNAAALQKLEDDRANASAQVLKDFIATLDYNNPFSAPTSGSADPAGPLSEGEIKLLTEKVKGWAPALGLTAPKATDPVAEHKKFIDDLRDKLQAKVDAATTNDAKNELKTYYQTQKIAAAQVVLAEIKAQAEKDLAAAKLAATQKTTSHQMDHAAADGRVTPAIVKLAKSLPNAINALMASEYGYMKDGVYKKPSASVEKLIKQAMKGQGVSGSTINAIDDKIIKPLYDATQYHNADTGDLVPGVISFSEEVNTFALKETAVSRLLIIKAGYQVNGKDVEQLFLANQTTKSPIDFESDGDVLQTIKSIDDKGGVNPLYTAANYLIEAVNREINPQITRDAAMALKRVVSEGVDASLKGIRSPKEFYELVKVAKAIDPTNKPIQEKALVEILLSLAKKYLFEGKDVKVDGDQIVKLVENTFKYDGTEEPTLTLDATAQDTQIAYGPLTKKIIEQINEEDFTDYSELTTNAVPLIKFVDPKMVNIDELLELMNSKEIKAMLPNFEKLTSTPEGVQLIKTNWELSLETVKRSDVSDVLKVINNPAYARITNDIQKMKDILAIKGTPMSDIDANLGKLLQSVKNNPGSEYLLDAQWETMGLPLLQSSDFTGSLKILNEPKFKDITNNAKDVKQIFSVQGTSLDTINTYLKAVIDAMGDDWVKNNKQWVLDNIDNENLQKMIADVNKDKFMNDVVRRNLILSSSNIDKTLANFDSIISAWGDKFINSDSKLEWFGQISKMKEFDDITKLFVKTTDDKQILASFDRIKEIVTGAESAIVKDAARTDIYDSILVHIGQAEKVTGYDTFYGANEKILMSALLNTKADITQALKDFTKYLTAPHVAGAPVIDLTDPQVMEQVTSASAVTAKLATQKLPAAQEEAVGNAMTSVIAAKALTQDEFKIVSTYTETVFKVFSDKVEAAKQLQKVLDPTVIKGEITHIDTFNKWVAAIEKEHPGVTITKDMIEKYVWTKDITETPYAQADGAEKMPDGYMIVSASYNAEDKGTYFVDHKLNTGRSLGKLVRDGSTTLVKKIEDNPELKAKDGGATPASSAYISGQTIHDGKIYWMGLNDNSGIAKYLYVYTIKTGDIEVVKLSRGSDAKINGRIRTLTWANGKLYAAISNEQAPETAPVKEFIEINPETGKYIYLGQDSGIKFFKDTSLGAYTYTSGAFVADGATYLISPTTTYKTHAHTWITITNRNSGRSSIIDLGAAISAIGGNWDKGQAAVGTILGEFDQVTRIQTIFIVDGDGAVIKLGVKIVGDGDATIGTRDNSLMSKDEGKTAADQAIQKGDPIIDRSKTMLLIDSSKPVGGTRGATFVDGAITVYGNTKAVYIADQTSNLNDIFKFLMEH